MQISVYDETLAAWSAWTDVGTAFTSSSQVWTLHLANLTRTLAAWRESASTTRARSILRPLRVGDIDDIQVSVQAPPDTDSDGLPSDWETKFGLIRPTGRAQWVGWRR